jgi:hypothetical protein
MSIRFILFAFILFPGMLVAGEISLQSGIKQNILIELYTSEGCNSCPPAERLLNSYTTKNGLWSKYIPLAFHVDYWDYLGWKDKFAKSAFGLRQKSYANILRNSTVYTPAFFVNGKKWRPGFFYKELPIQANKNAGELILNITNKKITAAFNAYSSIPGPLHLHIALLGMALETDIKAGENTGRKSRHEFVVLDYKKFIDTNRRWGAGWPPKNQHTIQASRYALAAWVSQAGNPTPIQATGAYLPPDFFAAVKK